MNDITFIVHEMKFSSFQKYIKLKFTDTIKLKMKLPPAIKYKIALIIVFSPDNFFLIKKLYNTEVNTHINDVISNEIDSG